MGRLCDNAKKWWFIEYGKTTHCPISIEYSSGDCEDGAAVNNELIWYMFGYIFRITFPVFLKHHAVKVYAKTWSKETIERLGRDWYWNYSTMRYGFSISDGYLHVHYGPDTGDSLTEKSKCWSFPWHEQRIVKEEIILENGDVFWSYEGNDDYSKWGDNYHNATRNCPKHKVTLKDFDDTEVTAELYRNISVYKRGTGKFKWLSWFTKPTTHDTISFEFDKETGTRKGSWKGGLIATSTKFLPGDTFHTAFKRWCDKNNMTIIT